MRTPFLITATLLNMLTAIAAIAAPNYDEDKIAPYTLPPLLPGPDATRDDWERVHRPAWVKTLNDQVYGAPLPELPPATFEAAAPVTILNGLATRQLVDVRLCGPDSPVVSLMIYLPAKAAGPVPVILMPNFQGNQSVEADPAIPVTTGWMKNGEGIVNNRSTEATRGSASNRFPIELIMNAGFGMATFHYSQVTPDRRDDPWGEGIYAWCRSRQIAHPESAIAAWAWGMSRMLDCLITIPQIDRRRIIAAGHSRLGKTSLLAGIRDPRFAAVISNNSGCCGAALNRRNYGEAIADVAKNFPHWFLPGLTAFAGHENEMAFDQHVVLACVAPRPLLISSAVEDRWADPRGEFLATQAAEPVYRLYGLAGPAGLDMPVPADDHLINQPLAYRYRPGKHDVTPTDWQAYIRFVNTQVPAQAP